MTTTIANNYKSCPLKKRPIVYEDEPIPLTAQSGKLLEEQPQDLSLKRKASDDIAEYVRPLKREYTPTPAVVVETTQPLINTHKYRADSPSVAVAALASSSPMLSPPADLEYLHADIHLRGLTGATACYTTDTYKSAFVLAAGCNPMSALWHSYAPSIGGLFPSPASSIAASPHSAYSYQHMTPPSSPGSDADSEPEDLSLRSDIPLPALFHHFDETPSKATGSKSHAAHATAHAPETTASKHYRYKCDKCSKMYSTSIGLSKHQQFHCPAAECNQEKKQHSCEECGKLYTTVGALKMHIRTHTLPCKCPICGKAFSRPWLLQGHIRTHTGEKPFKCDDCPRSFADRSNLRAHQQTHVDVKKYVCKVCNKSFSRMSLLTKHTNCNCTITIV